MRTTSLHRPYEETILYKLHVRGFTKDGSSRVKNKGTFRGVIEKIPYLKRTRYQCSRTDAVLRVF